MAVSIGTMIRTIDGLRGTKDITDWEEQFIKSVVERSANGNNTTILSAKQVEQIERIHNKHFGG